MMLLSRVATNLYWAARYLERAEDTARVVRTYTEMMVDLPTSVSSSWEPLLSVVGSRTAFDASHARVQEDDVVRYLVADLANPASVVASVAAARENLRTTREVFPREAWQAVNDLHLYAGSNGEAGVNRRSRARFLNRVIADCQQFDGVLASTMSRDAAYEFWRLGEAIERADMTTRVLGVRAATLLAAPADVDDHDEVQWMGVLRSLSAMQMYHRAVRGPIDGKAAVEFLLFDLEFPRSVARCAQRSREALRRLPNCERTLPAVDVIDEVLATLPTDAGDGAALDAAMDRVQVALASLSDDITTAFTAGGA
ncbi:unnamed protein product [Phaeothamnion confervicola]|jgi:uncharacterized alpha-E superfamily protein